MRDLTHITPKEADELFDERLIADGYTIISVIRSPTPRIRSALLQYVRTFGDVDRNFIDAPALERVLSRVSIPALCEASDYDYRCIFFRRQSEFLAAVPGSARDLLPIEDLNARFPDLPVENRGGRMPRWLKRFNGRLTTSITNKLSRNIKAKLLSSLTRTDPLLIDALNQKISSSSRFLADFYKDDQILYDELRTRSPQ